MTAIWRDPEWRLLDAAPQRVYMLVITQSEISPCGLIAVTEKRWATYAADTTAKHITDGLDQLEARSFIVLDHDTEELLVRTFAKNDGGAANALRRTAITDAAKAVASLKIAAVLADELDFLSIPHSLSRAYREPIDSPSSGLGAPVDSRRVGVALRNQVSNPNPQPANHNPIPRAPTASPRVAAGLNLAAELKARGE